MQSAPDDVREILGPNEQVQLYIAQKIYHPKINVDSVAITNERIILRHPHTLRLKKGYTDYNYQDISNVVLDKGILRSSVRCTLRFGGEALSLNDLPNSDAERAYGIIRENLVRFQAPFTPPTDGTAQPRQIMSPAPSAAYCKKCGSALLAGQRFCGSCGAPV